MRKGKIAFAVILCALAVLFSFPICADGEADELSVISANVSGLPAILSKSVPYRHSPTGKRRVWVARHRSGKFVVISEVLLDADDVVAAVVEHFAERLLGERHVAVVL